MKLMNRNKAKPEDETTPNATKKSRFGLFGKKPATKKPKAPRAPREAEQVPVEEVTPKEMTEEEVVDEIPVKDEELAAVKEEEEPTTATLGSAKDEETKDAVEEKAEQAETAEERDAPELEDFKSDAAAALETLAEDKEASAVDAVTSSGAGGIIESAAQREITAEMVDEMKAKALGSKTTTTTSSTGLLCGCI